MENVIFGAAQSATTTKNENNLTKDRNKPSDKHNDCINSWKKCTSMSN